MTRTEGSARRRGLNWRLLAPAIAAAGIALFIGANAHLIYVAFASQPECVPHSRGVETGGSYGAARSSC